MSNESFLDRLREVNQSRAATWRGGGQSWTSADWSNATLGEVGETVEAVLDALVSTLQATAAAGRMADTIKKLRRVETGVDHSMNAKTPDEYRASLSEEIADVIIYLDFVAHHFGIDLTQAIADKFNKVSIKNGFTERLTI